MFYSTTKKIIFTDFKIVAIFISLFFGVFFFPFKKTQQRIYYYWRRLSARRSSMNTDFLQPPYGGTQWMYSKFQKYPRTQHRW